MNEEIEIRDWVRHNRFKIKGQVHKIVGPEKDSKTILKVRTSDKLPLQLWELGHVTLLKKVD